MKTKFRSSKELQQGIPHGSILRSFQFNTHINDLFYALFDVDDCNYAGDTAPFVCDQSIENLLRKLENNAEIAISWFDCNYIKMNNDKCHLMILGNKHEHKAKN